MSACSQGRRVVDAVAGHRHYVASLLQRTDEAQLLLWRHPRKDVGLLDLLGQVGVRDLRKLLAGEKPVIAAIDDPH